MRGIFAGALALVALHTLVSYQGAQGRIAGAFSGVASLVDRFLDPSLPAIPDRGSHGVQGVQAPTVATRPAPPPAPAPHYPQAPAGGVPGRQNP